MANTIKSLTADLEAANLQNDALTQELAEAQRQLEEFKLEVANAIDEAKAAQDSKPWSNITGQKILLPASMDAKQYNGKTAVRPGEYDGIKTLDVTVRFMAGNRIGRAYDLVFRDNGHGPWLPKPRSSLSPATSSNASMAGSAAASGMLPTDAKSPSIPGKSSTSSTFPSPSSASRARNRPSSPFPLLQKQNR